MAIIPSENPHGHRRAGCRLGYLSLLHGWLLGVSALLGYGDRLQAQQASSGLPKAKSAHIRGADLSYLDMVQGDPVIFVHGSLGDLTTYSPQFEAFAARYRVVAS
jgi:hypothetical protein